MRFIGRLLKFNESFLWFDIGHGKVRRIPRKGIHIDPICDVIPTNEDQMTESLMAMQLKNVIDEIRKE